MPAPQPVGPLDADERAAVAELAVRAARVDGVAPLGEQVLLRLGDEGVRHLRTGAPGRPTAYAQIDPAGPTAELVVAPEDRRRGHGRAIARAALVPGTRIWAHGTLPGARALAAELGLLTSRTLLEMGVRLRHPPPELPLPDGLRLRSFLPGLDDDAWLAVNARAFVDLPDQGGWTARELHERMAQDWFDPRGFLLVVDAADRVVGFHWTKVTSHSTADGGHEHVGEVYVVGVDPSQQGRRLGRALTVAGLRHLAGQGVARVTLYVDGSNERALALYRSLGFEVEVTDTEYLLPSGPG